MRASMAYFAGAGTIIATIVAGIGGGLLIGDMIGPKSAKQGTEMTLLERRMSSHPIQAAAAPSEPAPYLVAPQPPAPATAVAAVPAQAETANAATPAQPADTSQTTAAAPARQAEARAQPAAPAAQPVVHEQAAAPDDSLAKARGGEARRAEGNRKFERRPQWTERRRYKPRQQQELIAVEEKVREDTEPRREFAAEPARIELPKIRLFGPE